MRISVRSAALTLLIAAGDATARQANFFTARVHVAPNPGNREFRETAVAVSTVNPAHLIVSWVAKYPGAHLGYAVSIDSGKSFVDGMLDPAASLCVKAPSASFGDPMVAASTVKDELWVGGVVQYCPQQALVVYHNPAAALTLGPPSVLECRLTCQILDKPFCAVGPDAAGIERMHLFFSDFAYIDPASGGPEMFGRSTADLATLTWDPDRFNIRRPGAAANEEGVAVIPVVLTGAPVRGRIVCVWRPTYPTGGTPVSMYSDDGGKNWLPTGGPTLLNQSGSSSSGTGLSAAASPIYPVEERDLPNGGEGNLVNTVPGVAVDPLDSRLVYAVFWGKSQGPADQRANVDLYIAQSRDGGATFPPQSTLHLTDAQLGDAPSSGGPAVAQFMPAITVDGMHGLNLLYYRMTDTGNGVEFQAKWARVPDPASGLMPAVLPNHVLSPKFTQPIVTGHGIGSLRDFQMIASNKTLVYAAYMSAHEGGAMNIYLTRINLCAADVTADGVVSAADVAAFTGALGTGEQAADVNGDGSVNGEDVNSFLYSLTNGCAGGLP